MLELKTLIKNLAINTSNTNNNILVADQYFLLKHYAAAMSFYLKSAESTENKDIQYYCLIRAAQCLEATGNRTTLCRSTYSHAINVLPTRPEAYYFISRNYEHSSDWVPSYTYANLGLSVANHDKLDEISQKLDYKGKYFLIFQKAVASWWWGKHKESRYLFHYIADNYPNVDDTHRIAIQNNIINLGSGEPFHYYYINDYDKLRFKFKNAEKIENNFSQVMQDIFVLSMLNGKSNGTYLEVGSADPFHGNNTFLLETMYCWTGIGIEYDKKFIQSYTNSRKNKILHVNALDIDYNTVLEKIAVNNVVDYLQLDCEPASTTYEILLKIPFDKYKFAVITYEHDYYADITKSYKYKSREYLSMLGYKLVVNDVCADNNSKCSFEDWWVYPELIDENILSTMLDNDLSTNKNIKDYMFNVSIKDTIDKSLIDKSEYQYKNYEINTSKANSTLWVVDNFYKDPDLVREFALNQEYIEGGFGRGFIGRRTEKQFLFDGLKERFEHIMNKSITSWQEHGMNGRFQIAWAGEPLVYHCDSQRWAGMLYLTPKAPYSTGTTMYANKKTKARTFYETGWDDAWKDMPGDPHLDKTPFEPVDVIGNVYNRLVIFDASCIHSASEYFGTVAKNARLWQMFFFD